MIGDSNYDKFRWSIEQEGYVEDTVVIIDKETGKIVAEETVHEMVDYAFRHTDYHEYDNCTWNKFCPETPSTCGNFTEKGCAKIHKNLGNPERTT